MQRVMMTLARVMAILGGLVLCGLILLTCVSVVGRALNDILHDFRDTLPGLADALLATGVGPVTGDFELVEAGLAFAVAAFIPYCQITGGHASVDLLVQRFGPRATRWRRALTEVLFAAVLILIARQLYEGTMAKMRFGETTFLLQFPIWWAYAACLTGTAASAVIGVYMAVLRAVEAVTGRDWLPDATEAAQ